jgi:hypothetical protein
VASFHSLTAADAASCSARIPRISVLLTWNLNVDLRSKSLTVIKTEAPPLILRMALLKNKSSYTPGAVQHFITLSRKMNWQNLHPVQEPAL